MVKVIGGTKGGGDILSAKDVLTAATAVTKTAGAVDPQVAALEKYVILADKGITILSQVQGVIEKAKGLGLSGNQPSAPTPVTRVPCVEDMPVVTRDDAPTITPSVIPAPSVGASEISQALGMILAKEPDLSVAQLKAVIDSNPDAINHLLAAYTKGAMI